MWHYYLVEEFIMNKQWLQENGYNWAAGRVECHSDNSPGYSDREYFLIIDRKDWYHFDAYLRTLNTKSLQSLEQLIQSSQLPIVRHHDYQETPS